MDVHLCVCLATRPGVPFHQSEITAVEVNHVCDVSLSQSQGNIHIMFFHTARSLLVFHDQIKKPGGISAFLNPEKIQNEFNGRFPNIYLDCE